MKRLALLAALGAAGLLAASPASAQTHCKEPVWEEGCCVCLLGTQPEEEDRRWSICNSGGCTCFGDATPCGTALNTLSPDGSLQPVDAMYALEPVAPGRSLVVFATTRSAAGDAAEAGYRRRECDAAVIGRAYSAARTERLRRETQVLRL